jgi:glutathione S-transferase
VGNSQTNTLVHFDPATGVTDRTFAFMGLIEMLGTGAYGITWDGVSVWITVAGNRTKKTDDDIDFVTINPLGLVPALEIEPGLLLTENAAILQFVAERFPAAGLIPDDPLGKAQLRKWLSFVGTELHKAVYLPLLDRTASAEVKAYALAKAENRLRYLARHLQLDNREFLLDRFTVADAYLFTVLNWSQVTPVDLLPWAPIVAYQKRLHERASVARAFAEEKELYFRELARHGDRTASPAVKRSGP